MTNEVRHPDSIRIDEWYRPSCGRSHDAHPDCDATRGDILLVDDDPAVRRMIAAALARRGYSTLLAEHGAVAVNILRSNRNVCLVVTDIYMPDLDGLEVIMAIKALEPGLPVIAMSGGGGLQGPASILKTARLLGSSRIISKPFDLEEFLLMVEQLLAR
jgi:CheY-like chemotaxis protein